MKNTKQFEEFKKLNPWPVNPTEEVSEVIKEMKKAEEGIGANGKSQRVVLDLFDRAMEILSMFPPDERVFTDPRPSLFDVTIWLVVSQSHRKVLIKAEYRYNVHECVITEFAVRET